jgi:hypothetical protein
MEIRSARVRLVQAGEMAGPAITLPGAVLRSAGLEILGLGTGTMPPTDVITAMLRELLELLASGKLRIDVERVPLSAVEQVWGRDQHGRRPVFVRKGPARCPAPDRVRPAQACGRPTTMSSWRSSTGSGSAVIMASRAAQLRRPCRWPVAAIERATMVVMAAFRRRCRW